jgi:hypothetical protein
MYQRLGRWLRILGYNTLFEPSASDQQMIDKAIKGKRVLITRDEELKARAEKVGIKTIIIKGSTIEQKLMDLAKKIPISLNFPREKLPRCTHCNSRIKEIPKKEIVDQLEEGTIEHYDKFWICTNEKCQQIYWQGSHWEKIEKTLEECKKKLKETET